MSKPPNYTSGHTRSCWMQKPKNRFDMLRANLAVDVAIIGAGISGLSCAYNMVKNGKSVAVIDDGIIGSGETGRSSGHLSSILDERYYSFIKRLGVEQTRRIAASHQEAIDKLENIISEENISCDFKRVDGFLFSESSNQSELQKEANALDELGVIPFDWVHHAPIKHCETGMCLRVARQGQFDPLKYVQGLAECLSAKGALIFEDTHAQKILDGEPCRIRTDTGAIITASDIIIASGSHINDRVLVHTKQAQYRTYIIALTIPKDEISEALYWDTLDPYHYMRLIPSQDVDKDCVIIGGEDHKTGQKNNLKQAFDRLHAWASKHISSYELLYSWSGQVIEPTDGLAFIGRNPKDKHVYILTGNSGNGLSYAALGANLIGNLILHRESPYEKIYAPSRKVPLPTYLQENLNTAAQYMDYFKPGDNTNNLKPGEGIILKRAFKPEALYKDKHGKIHRLSAVCPHLGGLVRWNALEKSWDCPCHGSRFSAYGDVLNGPANCGLKKLDR